ncbi:hypothetical protein ACIP4Y_35590 [Streptomyces sp. NPDC088810]
MALEEPLDLHAERYRAAIAATAPEEPPRKADAEPAETPLVQPEAGAE